MLASSPPIVRFAITGLGNTLLGFTVILIGLRLGIPDVPANALGYCAGLVLGFVVNRRWTFGADRSSNGGEVVRYLIAFVISWAINYLVVTTGLRAGFAGSPLLHLSGLAVYTACFYLLSRHFVFTPNTVTLGVFLRERLGEAIVIPATALFIVALHGIALTHDVVWQLWIARQMSHGVALYSQINELNPPLWFWMALSLERLGDISGTLPRELLIAGICLLALASSLFVGHLGRFEGPMERAWAMVATLVVGLFTSLYDFGQREQIVLIVALPYAFLLAARLDGRKPYPPITFAVALLASLGFALKHYFALVPLLLELLLLIRQRRNYRAIRVETMTLLAGALTYVAAIILFAPDFLHRIVPMVNLAYAGYEVPFWMWFDEPAQVIWVLTLLSLSVTGLWHRLSGKADVQALGVSMVGFFLAYIAQRKGWQYHAIPTSGMAALLLASVGFSAPQRLRDFASRPLIVMAFAVTFVITVFQGSYSNPREKFVGVLVDRVAMGGTVMVIASNPMWGWPAVENRHAVWGSRYFAHWMIPAIAIARAGHTDGPGMRALERTVKDETFVDIACASPDLIIIENREPSFTVRPADFDTLSFFSEDARFRDYLAANYRRDVNGRWLRGYYRVTPRIPLAANCRRVW